MPWRPIRVPNTALATWWHVSWRHAGIAVPITLFSITPSAVATIPAVIAIYVIIAVPPSVCPLIRLRLSASIPRVVAIYTTILRYVAATTVTVELVAFIFVQAPFFTVFSAPATPAFVIRPPTRAGKKQHQGQDFQHMSNL